MALINCPECNNEVSESASSCPFCGYSVATYVKKEKRKNKSNNVPDKHKIKKICKIAFVLSFVLCLILSICLYAYYNAEQIKAEQEHDRIYQDVLADSPGISVYSFMYMSEQGSRAEEMENLKNLTFPIAFGILVVVELIIFVIFKKASKEIVVLETNTETVSTEPRE